MFLANLTGEQKTAFLGLAQNLVASDGVLSDGEKNMMEQYRLEMALPPTVGAPTGSVEESVREFQAADASVQKQIIFELVALALADEEYAKDENRFLSELCASFHMDTDFLSTCQTYARDLTDLYAKIWDLVGI